MVIGSIAQAAREGDALTSILLWSGVLVIAVIVGALVISLVRRNFARSDEDQQQGFTLQELRDLHAGGELSDEEFDRAREALIGEVRGRGEGEGERTEPAVTASENSEAPGNSIRSTQSESSGGGMAGNRLRGEENERTSR